METSGGAASGCRCCEPLGSLSADRWARYRASGIVGRSPALGECLALVERAAQCDVTVLLVGETGAGKEGIARALHAQGPRSSARFVAVDCPAVVETLFQSEMFGHEAGAFTDARKDRAGMFEEAHRGTLFLDELGRLSVDMQMKLLRLLEQREVRPVGSTKPKAVDVRFIAGTNVDLERAMKAGRFTPDLYYRLAGFPIVVPPLRERAGDVPLLAEHFLTHFAGVVEKPIAGFTPAALHVLERYAWPGNVRELRNEVERLVVRATPGRPVCEHLLSPRIRGDLLDVSEPSPPTLREVRDDAEAREILSRLDANGWNKTSTAKSLGISRESLWACMRRLGLLDARARCAEAARGNRHRRPRRGGGVPSASAAPCANPSWPW